MNELIISIKLNLIRRQLYIKFTVQIKTSSYNNFDILQNILSEEEPKWVGISLSLVIIIILEQIPLPLRGLGVEGGGSSFIAVVLILYFYVQPSCWERVDLPAL